MFNSVTYNTRYNFEVKDGDAKLLGKASIDNKPNAYVHDFTATIVLKGLFNSSPFNTSIYNDEEYRKIKGALTAAGTTLARPNSFYNNHSTLTGQGITELINTRARSNYATMGAMALTVLENTRRRPNLGEYVGQAKISILPTKREWENIKFEDVIGPGDILVIDMEKLTVTLNGQNYRKALSQADYFNLRPGENYIEVTNAETGENVYLRVEWEDRWL